MADIDPETLYGTWRLVASHAVDAAGQPIDDPWGPSPMGCLMLDRSGRMAAVLCDGRTDLPPGQARTYSSYCGPFVITGNLMTTTIDAASDPTRIGTLQPRHLALDQDLLTLTPPPRKDGEQRKIIWKKIC